MNRCFQSKYSLFPQIPPRVCTLVLFIYMGKFAQADRHRTGSIGHRTGRSITAQARSVTAQADRSPHRLDRSPHSPIGHRTGSICHRTVRSVTAQARSVTAQSDRSPHRATGNRFRKARLCIYNFIILWATVESGSSLIMVSTLSMRTLLVFKSLKLRYTVHLIANLL